jgi:hypothetical protein
MEYVGASGGSVESIDGKIAITIPIPTGATGFSAGKFHFEVFGLQLAYDNSPSPVLQPWMLEKAAWDVGIDYTATHITLTVENFGMFVIVGVPSFEVTFKNAAATVATLFTEKGGKLTDIPTAPTGTEWVIEGAAGGADTPVTLATVYTADTEVIAKATGPVCVHTFGTNPVCGTTDCTLCGEVKFKCNECECILCFPPLGNCGNIFCPTCGDYDFTALKGDILARIKTVRTDHANKATLEEIIGLKYSGFIIDLLLNCEGACGPSCDAPCQEKVDELLGGGSVAITMPIPAGMLVPADPGFDYYFIGANVVCDKTGCDDFREDHFCDDINCDLAPVCTNCCDGELSFVIPASAAAITGAMDGTDVTFSLSVFYDVIIMVAVPKFVQTGGDYCVEFCLKPTCDDCIFAHRAACTFAACATRPAGSTPSTALRGAETFLAGECRFGGMGDVSHVGSVTGAGALLAFRASMNDAAVVGNIDYLAAYVNGQSPPTANAGRPTGAQALLIFRRSMNDPAVVFVNPPKPNP